MCPILAGSEQLDPNSGANARSMKGMRNFALSPAYTKSQCVSMVVPPPMAAPWTAATIGFSKSTNAFINRACGESPAPGGLFRKILDIVASAERVSGAVPERDKCALVPGRFDEDICKSHVHARGHRVPLGRAVQFDAKHAFGMLGHNLVHRVPPRLH